MRSQVSGFSAQSSPINIFPAWGMGYGLSSCASENGGGKKRLLNTQNQPTAPKNIFLVWIAGRNDPSWCLSAASVLANSDWLGSLRLSMIIAIKDIFRASRRRQGQAWRIDTCQK